MYFISWCVSPVVRQSHCVSLTIRLRPGVELVPIHSPFWSYRVAASSYPENYVTQFGERLLNAPSDIEYRDVTIEVFHMLRGVLDSDEVKQRFRNLRFKCRAEESLDGYMLARKLKSSTLCPERSHKGAKQPSEQG
jgi:hypothetical protein